MHSNILALAMWEVRFWKFDNELQPVMCVVNGFESIFEASAWLMGFLNKERANLKLDLAHVPFWIPSGMPESWHSQAANEENALDRLMLVLQPADHVLDLGFPEIDNQFL